MKKAFSVSVAHHDVAQRVHAASALRAYLNSADSMPAILTSDNDAALAPFIHDALSFIAARLAPRLSDVALADVATPVSQAVSRFDFSIDIPDGTLAGESDYAFCRSAILAPALTALAEAVVLMHCFKGFDAAAFIRYRTDVEARIDSLRATFALNLSRTSIRPFAI